MKQKHKSKRQESQKTPNADMVRGAMTIGKWTVPQISLKSIILLEKINSPFAEKTNPECPKCGKVFEDDRPDEDIKANVPIECPGCEKQFQIKTSIGELSEALFVLVNQDREDIAELVEDPKRFQAEVLKMASEMDMTELASMTATISVAMADVNALADKTSDAGGTEKNAGNGPSD